MKFLLFLAALSLASGQIINTGRHRVVASGGGGFGLRSGCANVVNPDTTINCVMGSALGAGDIVPICAIYFGTRTVTWGGDGGTFTPDPGAGTALTNIVINSADDGRATCVILTAAGGSATLTASISGGSGYLGIFSGAVQNSSGGFDKSDNGRSDCCSMGNPASNNITPSGDGEMLIGFCFSHYLGGGQTQSVGSNVAWTALPGSPWSSTIQGFGEYFLQTTAASVNAQCASTDNSYRNWAHIVAVKP